VEQPVGSNLSIVIVPLPAAIGLAAVLVVVLGVWTVKLRGLVDWLDAVGLVLQGLSVFGLFSLILWALYTSNVSNPVYLALQVGVLLPALVGWRLRMSRRPRLKQNE